MPINGVTRNQQQRGTEGKRCLGRLKKGELAISAKTGKPYPRDLNYFRVVWEDERLGTHDPALDPVREKWLEMYGAEPDRFENVHLLTRDPQRDAWMELWKKTKQGVPFLAIRCDREVQVAHYDFEKQELSRTPIPCAYNPDDPAKSCGCTATFRLALYLRDLIRETGVLGYFLLTQGSEKEITDTIAAIESATEIAAGIGVPLSEVPFVMDRHGVPMNVPGVTGQQMKSLVSFAPDAGWVKMVMASGDGLALPAGDHDDPIEGQITDGKPDEDDDLLETLAQRHYGGSWAELVKALDLSFIDNDPAASVEECSEAVMQAAAESGLPLLAYSVTILRDPKKNSGKPVARFDLGFGTAFYGDITILPESLQTGMRDVALALPVPYSLTIMTASNGTSYVVATYQPHAVEIS